MKHGKKYNAAAAKYDLSKKYDVASACKMVQDMKFANFDETVEAHVVLRLEKNATVRDTLVFPNQFKGEKKVLVFCKGDKVKEALDAGAAFAGEEYIDKVKDGWLDFDVAVATPDMMKDVGRLGMVLGRKGLMPNPKTGTVTPNVGQAVAELKKGRTEFRADKTGFFLLTSERRVFTLATSLSVSIEHLPTAMCTIPALSARNSVRPFLSSATA